jgi:hypothetical protein
LEQIVERRRVEAEEILAASSGNGASTRTDSTGAGVGRLQDTVLASSFMLTSSNQ